MIHLKRSCKLLRNIVSALEVKHDFQRLRFERTLGKITILQPNTGVTTVRADGMDVFYIWNKSLDISSPPKCIIPFWCKISMLAVEKTKMKTIMEYLYWFLKANSSKKLHIHTNFISAMHQTETIKKFLPYIVDYNSFSHTKWANEPLPFQLKLIPNIYVEILHHQVLSPEEKFELFEYLKLLNFPFIFPDHLLWNETDRFLPLLVQIRELYREDFDGNQKHPYFRYWEYLCEQTAESQDPK